MQLWGRPGWPLQPSLRAVVRKWLSHVKYVVSEVREEMERELEHLLKQKDEQAALGLCLSRGFTSSARTHPAPVSFWQLRAVESKLAASERSRQNATRLMPYSAGIQYSASTKNSPCASVASLAQCDLLSVLLSCEAMSASGSNPT